MRDPALLVVDMQNDFVRVGAPLEVPDARATIAPHQRLIGAFRARGLPVVFTQFLAARVAEPPVALVAAVPADTKCCWKGHRRRYADIDGDARLHRGDRRARSPYRGDIVIEKYGYGAFHATDLDGTCARSASSRCVVTGTVTQICVEETAREAFHHGYRTTMVADAVSSFAPDLHAATLKNFAMKFGWVADTDDGRCMAVSSAGRRDCDLAATGIWLLLAAAIACRGCAIPAFRDPANLANVLRQSGALGILAIGQTFVIAAGHDRPQRWHDRGPGRRAGLRHAWHRRRR